MSRAKKEGEFLILDGHSLAYRAFFALPLELKTKDGLHTNAVFGFTNMLLRLLKERAPGYVAVAFDYPAPTFRHQKYEQYKATREKTPPEMNEQLPLIKEILEALNIYILELEGYEADDIIGTFADVGEKSSVFTVIVTADADAYQLLSEKVKILITRKGITQLEEFDLNKLKESYGLEPEQWIDFKALKGDTSDNIPGVPGIGEKRALQLLKEFGSLDNLIQNAGQIPGKLGENIVNFSQQALLGRELARIKKDIPVTFRLENCLYREPQWERLFNLFTRLEFKSLIEKNPELFKFGYEEKKGVRTEEKIRDVPVQRSLLEADNYFVSNSKSPKLTGDYIIVKGSKELALFQEKILKAQSLSALFNSEEPGMSIAFEDGSGFYLPLSNTEVTGKQLFELMVTLWKDRKRTFIVYDYKPLLKYLLKNDFKPSSSVFDILLAAYLLEPDKPSYDPALLVRDYLNISLPHPEKKAGEKTKKEQQKIFMTACAKQLFALKDILLNNLKAGQLVELYHKLELPLVQVLAKMELRGIKVDLNVLDALAEEVTKTMETLEREIYLLAGEEFNLNSPKQLGYVLFEKLKLPVIKRNKTGYSTEARVLEELSREYAIAKKILDYRTVSKLKTTYLEGLRSLINPETGKVHTTYNQAVTATGRLSSKDPNLQNIPVRLEEGRRIRQAFIPSSEEYLLLAADYSQIELRILAHLSKDPNLLDAFQNDQDIHTRTAAEVFNVDIEEVTPLMRNRAKAVNFGIIYGISDYSLSQDLKISRAEARCYIENYFKRYPGVKNYIDRCISAAREKGYVTTIMNRRRFLPDINHSNFARRSFAERMARNTPIQGSAADIIKAAMVTIDRELEEMGSEAVMLLQVHDELVFEVPVYELEEISKKIKEIMENIYSLSVPLKVDLKVGKNWYQMERLKGGG